MQVELLLVPGCPNEAAAAELVGGVLREHGKSDTALIVRVISSQAEAAREGFTGSPTLRVNSSDPFAEPGRAPALACAGCPTTTVRAALRAADPTGGSAR